MEGNTWVGRSFNIRCRGPERICNKWVGRSFKIRCRGPERIWNTWVGRSFKKDLGVDPIRLSET